MLRCGEARRGHEFRTDGNVTIYLCVQCDNRFEATDDKPRCPKCLRINGIIPGAAPQSSSPLVPRRWWPLAASLALLLGLGLVFWWSGSGNQAVRPQQVLQEVGLPDKARAVDVLQESAALRARVEPLRGRPAAVAQAQQLLLGAGGGLRFEPASLQLPLTREPLDAGQAFDAIQNSTGRPVLYPLEVCTLLVAGLRAAGLVAHVGEAHDTPPDGRRGPLDPSGVVGYYAVLVGELSQERQVLDPFRGQGTAPGDVRPLTDDQVVGAYLGLRALALLNAKADAGRALPLVDAALRLDGRSATLRSIQAQVLLESGGVVEAENAARNALQLRPDAARHHALARYLLLQGDTTAADKHLTAALELRPEYRLAQLSRVNWQMGAGQWHEAEALLQEVAVAQPQLPELHLTYARYHAAQGDLEQAITAAETAVEQADDYPLFWLALGQLYRAAGRDEDVQRVVRSVLELVPEGDGDALSARVTRVLGVTP